MQRLAVAAVLLVASLFGGAIAWMIMTLAPLIPK